MIVRQVVLSKMMPIALDTPLQHLQREAAILLGIPATAGANLAAYIMILMLIVLPEIFVVKNFAIQYTRLPKLVWIRNPFF